jgi:DNA-binding NarL/FixJ family response regulator
VDDDDACRTLITTVLEAGGHPVVEAATGEEALELAAGVGPGLVVLDICLPGISGYQVCHVLRERFGGGLPIIFVSGVRTESFDRVAGLLIGADDYLEKPFALDELLIRVGRLIRRATPLSVKISARLTPREREVLRFLGDGMSAREIAEELWVSPKTVGTHCEHIFRKLGVRTRAQAVAVAFRENLVDPPAELQQLPQRGLRSTFEA